MSVLKLPAATNDLEKAQVRDKSSNADISSNPPPDSASESGSSSSTGEDNDDDWNDWVDDDGSNKVPCTSLFDDSKHSTLEEAIEHDRQQHGFDLSALKLEFYARVRLINYLRKERPSVEAVKALTGKEAFLSDDAYLIPVVQDDPYLSMSVDDGDWSDEDGADSAANRKPEDKDQEIRKLTEKLDQARRDLADFRQLVERRFSSSEITEAAREDVASSANPLASTTKAVTPKRDDDTHYFLSYGDNGELCLINSLFLAEKVGLRDSLCHA